jgi:chaperonin GroEL
LKAQLLLNELKNEKEGIGYNAADDKFEDMIASLVLLTQQWLPVLLFKTLLPFQHCFLTTEAVVADKPEDNPAPAAPAAPGMGGMM